MVLSDKERLRWSATQLLWMLCIVSSAVVGVVYWAGLTTGLMAIVFVYSWVMYDNVSVKYFKRRMEEGEL